MSCYGVLLYRQRHRQRHRTGIPVLVLVPVRWYMKNMYPDVLSIPVTHLQLSADHLASTIV